MYFKNKKIWILFFTPIVLLIFIFLAEFQLIHSQKTIIETVRQIQENKKEPYESAFFSEEPSFTSDFPGAQNMISYAESNNFKRLYDKLVLGLDRESIDTVDKILTRFRQIFSGETKPQFTSREIIELGKLRRDFKILKISEDCYTWNGYFLPINHFEASVFFYQNGITNIKDLRKLKEKNIIDVGGFIGDSALIFSNYTDKKVYSFEPSSKNFGLMQKTISMNKKNNIVPIKLGLGSKSQDANIPLEVRSDLKTDQSQSEKFLAESSETIKIITLDQFVTENNIDIGLIKVDIEGNEQDFLKGAESTIKKQRPFLLISIYHSPSDFFNIKPMIESWGLEYNFKIVKCTDGQVCAETLLIASPI